MELPWSAGIWEQNLGLVVWSRHATSEAAHRAAVLYAQRRRAMTGGALSWSGGVRGPDGTVRWYQGTGEEVR